MTTSIEHKTSQQQIRHLREQSFLSHSGLSRMYEIRRGILGYQDNLPKFEGKTLLEILDGMNKKHAFNVLDIGCGAGVFLRDVIRNFPAARTHGISAFDYRGTADSFWKPFIDQVDYRINDAQKLRRIFPDVRFDLIVSVYAFEYFGDPLAVIKQAYSLLKKDGILLVDNPGPYLTTAQAELLRKYWIKQGVTADLERLNSFYTEQPSNYSFAILKGKNPRLPLPFSYDRISEDYQMAQFGVKPFPLRYHFNLG